MNKFISTVSLCMILFIPIGLHASSINLTEKDMYVRQGFDKKWIESLPDGNDKAWQKFPAHKDNRPVRVRQLKFKNLPKFRHFSLEKYPDMTFTYVTSFELTREKIEGKPLGLFLGQIGLNWEVYVNGSLLKSEVHLSKDGSIEIERAVRGETIILNHLYLKEGLNILAFKIIGNPVNDRTGLFMKKGYFIDAIENLKTYKNYIIRLILIGIYFFFGLYHLFLFSIRKKEIYNLAYAAFSLAGPIYMLCRVELIYSFVKDSALIKNIELSFVGLLPITLVALIELLGRKRLSLFGKVWAISMSILPIMIFFIWQETLLRIGQVWGLTGMFYALISGIILPFRKTSLKNIKKLRDMGQYKPILTIPLGIMKSLLFSIPGNLVIGVIVLFTSAFIDIIKGNAGQPTDYTTFGFAFFLLGIAGILANRFVHVHKRVEELNVTLEEKVLERTEELTAANQVMSALHENLVEARDHLWGEMLIAEKIQTVLLPVNPQIPGYEISSFMETAEKVSGDYYDIINSIDRDWIIIGDVSGHGVPAGLIMMMVQSCIRSHIDNKPDIKPSKLLEIVNKTISHNIELMKEKKFMTITAIAIDKEGKAIFSGRHEDILVYRSSNETIEVIKTDGICISPWPLGKNDINIEIKLEVNDILMLYTDGLIEGRQKKENQEGLNQEEHMYGVKQLIEIFQKNAQATSLEKIREHILKSLEDYEIDDDVTMIHLKRVE